MVEATASDYVVDAKRDRLVIVASSLGTVFEWYDFFIYGTLAPLIATLFFPSTNPTAGLLLTFATFGAGFFVRPIGAVLFGVASVPTMAVPSVPTISTTSAVEQVRSDRRYRSSGSHWRHRGYASRRHHYRGHSSYRSYRKPGFSFYIGTPRHRYGEYGRSRWY